MCERIKSDAEYQERECPRCIHRHQPGDWCNIVITMSGEPRCTNLEVSEDGHSE